MQFIVKIALACFLDWVTKNILHLVPGVYNKMLCGVMEMKDNKHAYCQVLSREREMC